MTTLGKIIVLALGYFLLLPCGFMLLSDNFWIILCGIVYFVVIVFSGNEKDRKFWKVWWRLHYYLCWPMLEGLERESGKSEYDESTTDEVR